MSDDGIDAGRSNDLPELRHLVRKHRVCWEVWPEAHLQGGDRRVIVGYDVELYGTHDRPAHPPAPGCVECRTVHRALTRIARYALPRDHRPTRYDVDVFDSALHYSPRRRSRADVTLVIRLHHRIHFHAPIDECQRVCLRDIETALALLGVQRGDWTEPATSRCH